MTTAQVPVARSGSRLGHWNSAVTTYYVASGATALLVAIGLVMVLSSSAVDSIADSGSPYVVFVRQAQFALLGLVAMFVTSRMRVTTLRRFAWPGLAVAIGLQMLVFTPLGRAEGGNRNWVYLGGTAFQPSELVKLALALWLGAVLARKTPLLREWKHAVIPAIPLAAAAVGVVLLGHDLGTAMIMILLVGGAMFVAGVPMRIFGVAAVAAAGLVAVLAVSGNNRMARITGWLSADCDLQAACYQPKHGMWALGSGGTFGMGLGASREKWSYLPAAHNDFIFAIVGEELGLVGTLLVLGLFGLLAAAFLRLVARHPDPFVKITTAGIGAWIIGQALVNIAVVIGLAPVIGVPLPLVSAGGSALIVTMAAMGVVIALARSEPGAAEALAARPGVLRRSLAVLGRSGSGAGRPSPGRARG